MKSMRTPAQAVIIATLALTAAFSAHAQQTEAETGFGIQGTLSGLAAAGTEFGEAPRSGSLVDGGFRLMLYPTWKISEHWSVAGACQTISRPYYHDDFSTQGHGVRASIVQAYLSYSQVGKKASLVVRIGELSSAFGSFSLHYDDRDNPMVDLPMQYGYYGAAATLSALAGVQVDATWHKWDARGQFVNSSPANPRSVLDSEQYGSWAGGAGYTIRQGLRVGASGYRGPYLDRHYPFYFPGEALPRSLPASGVGVEGQWGHGHWNVRGEMQRFVMQYKLIPDFHQRIGYTEVQRSLGPRWYVAARYGYLNADYVGTVHSIETVAGFRPGPGQIIKLSYETRHSTGVTAPDRTLVVQFVTAIHPLSFVRH